MTTPLDQYVAPATGKGAGLAGLWRLALGICVILAFWVGSTVLVLGAVTVVKMNSGLSIPKALDAMRATVTGGTPQGVLLQLMTFSGVWVGVWAAARFLHGQRFSTLFSPRGRIRWGEFAGGLLLCIPFWLVSLILGMVFVGPPQRTNVPLTLWVASLTPLALMVFLQATAEELIFRGYILQQLAARFRSPLVWAFLPALIFGLFHYANGTAFGPGIGFVYVLATLLYGLSAAAMVWRTGSLALAMGYHTGMNLMSLSLTGISGLVDGTKLFAYGETHATLLLGFDTFATALLLAFMLSPLCPWGRRPAIA